MSRRRFSSLDVGGLPVGAVAATIGLALRPGDIRFSARAQAHAFRRHPDVFDLCLARLPDIVAAPDYIGRSPHQPDGFELVGALPSVGGAVLVAIKLKPDIDGRYIVASTYRLDSATVARRLRKGFLVAVQT